MTCYGISPRVYERAAVPCMPLRCGWAKGMVIEGQSTDFRKRLESPSPKPQACCWLLGECICGVAKKKLKLQISRGRGHSSPPPPPQRFHLHPRFRSQPPKQQQSTQSPPEHSNHSVKFGSIKQHILSLGNPSPHTHTRHRAVKQGESAGSVGTLPRERKGVGRETRQGEAACGGKGFKERAAVSGERPIGASCRQQHQVSCNPTHPPNINEVKLCPLQQHGLLFLPS